MMIWLRSCNLLALLLLTLLLLPVMSCGTGAVNEPAAEKQSQPSPEAPPDAKKSMVQIRNGAFYSGITEQQFQFYLSQTKMNFPGMIEQMRERVTIPPRDKFEDQFYISRFEVTNREFKNFLLATSYRSSVRQGFLHHWEGDQYPDWGADFPVVWVSSSDAAAYCRWIGGELPSETQWEKAARGASDARAFPWGEALPSQSLVNCASSQAEPVGDRAEDISPFQVYDLGGNVSEFTRSAIADRPEEFIIRGGSFQQSGHYALVGVRLRSAGKNLRFKDVGFRCVAY